MQGISTFSGAPEGIARHSASFCLNAGKLERLIILESFIKLRPPFGDFTCACLDGLSIECGHRDLPWRREHELGRGQNAFADELVNRTNADTEPHGGLFGADRLDLS